jgi:MSHA biogenesis protein MshO
MTSFKEKPPIKRGMKRTKAIQGFTLMELILVIIILGIMAVGISGFITLSAQTYLNATSRDELIGNARFVIERLTRELRDAVPNSIRIGTYGSRECIQFSPIVASTAYVDIPVMPEVASKIITVIPFNDNEGNPYQCDSDDGCSHFVIVYPLKAEDIHENPLDQTGKIFIIDKTDNTVDPWKILLANENDIHFTGDTPTQRLYIASNQVSYCTFPTPVGAFMVRYENGIKPGDQIGGSQPFVMAGYLDNTAARKPFTYQNATLERNAVVQLYLHFTKEDEDYIFDHEVHIKNVP